MAQPAETCPICSSPLAREPHHVAPYADVKLFSCTRCGGYYLSGLLLCGYLPSVTPADRFALSRFIRLHNDRTGGPYREPLIPGTYQDVVEAGRPPAGPTAQLDALLVMVAERTKHLGDQTEPEVGSIWAARLGNPSEAHFEALAHAARDKGLLDHAVRTGSAAGHVLSLTMSGWERVEVLRQGASASPSCDYDQTAASTAAPGEFYLDLDERGEPITVPVEKRPVKVFISYAHDSDTDKRCERVLRLAQRLRREGVDAWIDRFDPHPPQGWEQWMRDRLAWADFVLVVCSEIYRRRWEGREPLGAGDGASFEGLLLREELYEQHCRTERIIPVTLRGEDRDHRPSGLRNQTYYALYEEYDDLYFRLTGQPDPEMQPAPLGMVRSRGSALPPSTVHWTRMPTGSDPRVKPPHSCAPTHCFVARSQLQKIERHLSDSRIALLHGPPGVGKTWLAYEFANNHAQELFPEGVIWLDAGRLAQDLTTRCTELGYQGGPEGVRSFLTHLLDKRRILVVVDNVDPEKTNLQDLFWMKTGRGGLLVTSRWRTLIERLPANVELVDVKPWPPLDPAPLHQIVAYLNPDVIPTSRCMAAEWRESLVALTRLVGGLPVAIAQLARELSRGQDPVVLRQGLLQTPAEILVGERNSHQGAIVLYQAILDDLQDTDRTAWLALAACSNDTTTAAVARVSELGERHAARSLHGLVDRGLALGKLDSRWGLHDIPRMALCQLAAFDQYRERHERWALSGAGHEHADRSWAEVGFALERLLLGHHSLEHVPPNEAACRVGNPQRWRALSSLCRDLLDWREGSVDELAWLPVRLATAARFIPECGDDALRLVNEVLPSVDSNLMKSDLRHVQVQLLLERGQTPAAIQTCEQWLREVRSVNEGRTVAHGFAQHLYARALSCTGRNEEAVQTFTKVLELKFKLLRGCREDHIYANALHERGVAYLQCGKLDAAEKDLTEALNLRKRLASEGRPRPQCLASSFEKIGRLHELRGHLDRAWDRTCDGGDVLIEAFQRPAGAVWERILVQIERLAEELSRAVPSRFAQDEVPLHESMLDSSAARSDGSMREARSSPPSTPPTEVSRKALIDLLIDLFSNEELRRWLTGLPGGSGVQRATVQGATSPAQLCREVAEELERAGMVDDDLWSSLQRERPRRKQDIARVKALW